MKKILSWFTLCALLLTAAGCSKASTPDNTTPTNTDARLTTQADNTDSASTTPRQAASASRNPLPGPAHSVAHSHSIKSACVSLLSLTARHICAVSIRLSPFYRI